MLVATGQLINSNLDPNYTLSNYTLVENIIIDLATDPIKALDYFDTTQQLLCYLANNNKSTSFIIKSIEINLYLRCLTLSIKRTLILYKDIINFFAINKPIKSSVKHVLVEFLDHKLSVDNNIINILAKHKSTTICYVNDLIYSFSLVVKIKEILTQKRNEAILFKRIYKNHEFFKFIAKSIYIDKYLTKYLMFVIENIKARRFKIKKSISVINKTYHKLVSLALVPKKNLEFTNFVQDILNYYLDVYQPGDVFELLLQTVKFYSSSYEQLQFSIVFQRYLKTKLSSLLENQVDCLIMHNKNMKFLLYDSYFSIPEKVSTFCDRAVCSSENRELLRDLKNHLSIKSGRSIFNYCFNKLLLDLLCEDLKFKPLLDELCFYELLKFDRYNQIDNFEIPALNMLLNQFKSSNKFSKLADYIKSHNAFLYVFVIHEDYLKDNVPLSVSNKINSVSSSQKFTKKFDLKLNYGNIILRCKKENVIFSIPLIAGYILLCFNKISSRVCSTEQLLALLITYFGITEADALKYLNMYDGKIFTIDHSQNQVSLFSLNKLKTEAETVSAKASLKNSVTVDVLALQAQITNYVKKCEKVERSRIHELFSKNSDICTDTLINNLLNSEILFSKDGQIGYNQFYL